MTFLFWISLSFIIYVLAGYPLLLLLAGVFVNRKRPSGESTKPLVDVVIPAHNEAAVIRQKLENTLTAADIYAHDVSILVVSDGSTDGTAARARDVSDSRIRVIETPERYGKLAAINHVLEQLHGEIVIFSDANAILSPGAIKAMIPHFADPRVGGVCGQIDVTRKKDGAIAGADSLYWRYDQWIKQAESDLGGVVAAQGALYAMRRNLVAPLPPGVADDFVMSARVVSSGYRLAFEPRATAVEAVTENAGNEMGRRIRSVDMGLRGMILLRHLANPVHFGLYAWQLISHKLMRFGVPVALVLVFVSSVTLAADGPGWAVTVAGQALLYGLGAMAFIRPRARRLPLAAKAMFFCMSNVAIVVGTISGLRSGARGIWSPVRDDTL